jgi:hypothetical protein
VRLLRRCRTQRNTCCTAPQNIEREGKPSFKDCERNPHENSDVYE